MNDFFSRVYKIVAQIPKGNVATYGQIAAMLGNPLAARTGAMTPAYAFGGECKQREMREREGVSFLENGCVDMGKCLWRCENA